MTRRLGIARGDFLGTGARRVGLPFLGVDAAGTVDPLGVVDGVEPTVDLGVAPPLDPDEETLLIFGDRLDVRIGDHAPVADEDEPAEREPLAQIADDFLNCGMVDAVAGPDVVGDRPAGDHHHADDHLDVLRLAVAAVAVLGEVVRAGALEVGAGDVVEDQIGLEAEEVAEAVIQRHFDLVLGLEELVEGAVPGIELAGMDADPSAAVPMGDEPSALAVADEVGLEPAGQAMLTGRGDEPVGDQHEGAVGKRDAFGSARGVGRGSTRGRVGRTRRGRRGPAPSWRHRRHGVRRGRRTWPSASPARSRRSLGRMSTRRSLRPRSATTRCLTLPSSR